MADNQSKSHDNFGLDFEFGEDGSGGQGDDGRRDDKESAGAHGPPRADFAKLKYLLDVPLKVSVQLGATKMMVNDFLDIGVGSIIELDKLAGEPMDILINDRPVALGEVVVVNEKFGVRLTDVISQFGVGPGPANTDS